MAGNYPDHPNNRMAMDIDGTQMFRWDEVDNVVVQLSAGEVNTLCNESNDGVSIGGTFRTCRLIVIFPELRDLTGFFFVLDDGDVLTPEWSADTTNGIDGTWTPFTAYTVPTIVNGYRSEIRSGVASGVRGLRITDWGGSGGTSAHAVHCYGDIASGENPNRLQLWHPTSDIPLDPAYFDWGNVPRGGSADRTFRVKNRSATLTANTITLSVDSLTDTSPSTAGQHTISNGGAFAATQAITSIAPGGFSAVHTLRRTTPSNAVLGAWAARLRATAVSWT